MQPIKLSPLQTFWRSLIMVLQAAPKELRYLTILTLISGTGSPSTLFFNKIIIDQISHLLGKFTTVSSFTLILQEPLLLGSIGGLILLNLLTESMNAIASLVFSSLRDRVQGFAQSIVLNKVANFADIALFETPELLNLVQLAETGIERLKELSLLVITTLHGFFILIPAILLSGSIAWWIPLILFTSATPAIYVELTYRKKSWEVEEAQASLVRQMNLHKDVLVGEAYAKELRLFQLQPLLLDRWQNLFQTMFRSMQQIRKKGTVLVITWSMVNGLGTALPYIYVVIGALRGIYTLGDLALYAGLILQVRQSLFLLINNGSNLYDVVLGTRPIFQLLELKPKLRLSLASREDTAAKLSLTPKAIAQHQGIEIKNLSFSYPGSDSKILDNINLTIQPHQMIALVGENGAGKTTLAKLLCRLYDPGSGEILWNGQDLREIGLTQLYSRLAVVMQDYARFPATVCENVGFGYLPALQDVNAIQEALRAAGIAKAVDNLPQGLETLLGKQLAGGVDLSGGQWQRIAIARALMRLSSAELLILDEPTSALDPKTEHEIYQLLRAIAANKMAVVISHRLALSKLADRIIVLENGKIIETGSHEELIARGGQYHLMFTRQASSYQ
ncbi:ABC transporter ATP-binding protein [Nostoc sp. NZL]|uniref:ABC transporter ATP-binding protein n=1 Tax=Nostoc sp. NZL TaxID=2650612 RepID=UPI0018C7B85A|nr:ABC transporter ATP-binding protein [Nostoc sp. NZL]MBG1243348.1 ABC transporter ATP-binding protein [Nostoc sp. NZL]